MFLQGERKSEYMVLEKMMIFEIGFDFHETFFNLICLENWQASLYGKLTSWQIWNVWFYSQIWKS